MQTSLQTALERAVTSLPPEQAAMIPPKLARAFLGLPVAHKRALLVGDRLTLWVSLLTYDPASARRYALLSAGEPLPPAPARVKTAPTPDEVKAAEFRTMRQWLADILSQEPAQFAQLEQDIGTHILMTCSDTDGLPFAGRWGLRAQFGHYGMVVLTHSPWFRRVNLVNRHEFIGTSCQIHPHTH